MLVQESGGRLFFVVFFLWIKCKGLNMLVPVTYSWSRSGHNFYLGNCFELHFPKRGGKEIDTLKKEYIKDTFYFPREFNSELFPRKGDSVCCLDNPEWGINAFPVVDLWFSSDGKITLILGIPDNLLE